MGTCQNSLQGPISQAVEALSMKHKRNWGLIWSLHYSSDEQLIEIITEIKFAIINLLILSWEERLTCFDCNWQIKLTSNASRVVCRTRACSIEKQTVARSGFSLVWRRRNQLVLLTGYGFRYVEKYKVNDKLPYRRNGGNVMVNILISFHSRDVLCALSRLFVRPGFRFCARLAVHYLTFIPF